VPKTLIQYIIRWVAQTQQLGPDVTDTLLDVLATEISPELVPSNGAKDVQSSEAVVGPYELQDFNLYYISRFGYRPSKVAFMAHHAWQPDYSLAEIKRWLEVFVHRFFQLSQFKRSCLPNGPKVGSGGSLSPRSDWRAPSDATATVWLEQLEAGVPDQE
jgi:NAD+ synthase (glutamine-hydrolysing)